MYTLHVLTPEKCRPARLSTRFTTNFVQINSFRGYSQCHIARLLKTQHARVVVTYWFLLLLSVLSASFGEIRIWPVSKVQPVCLLTSCGIDTLVKVLTGNDCCKVMLPS